MSNFSEILGPDGPLASALDNFTVRKQQQALADAVGNAIGENYSLVAEAGTGVGKTYAYLVPVLLSGRQVVISTGTRHLQDQLFFKDLPVIQKVLGMPSKAALLKGRSNYLCLYRLQNTQAQPFLSGSNLGDDLEAVEDWSSTTKRGDINELDSVPESSAAWPLVTSTIDNCLGQQCPFWDDCYLVKARRAAQDADIVVINHHLMLADLVLKEEGFGELLPGADVIIVDEAHQFPEIAAQHFGVSVSSRQLNDLVRDMKTEYQESAGDVPGVPQKLDGLATAVKNSRDVFGHGGQRIAWQSTDEPGPGEKQLAKLLFALQALLESCDGLRDRARGLDNCIERAERFHDRLEDFLASGNDSEVRWVETFSSSFSLNTVPLDPAAKLAGIWESHPASWIFTSATLSVGQDLQHFLLRVGMPEAETLILDSPFDYANNTMLYLPENLPGPGETEHTERVVQIARNFVTISGGGAFLLFTSYRAMNYAADRMRELQPNLHYLIQKQAPKNSLLEEFRQHGDAVLLGTTSFWEGVDVKGAALRLVVIDKLPFASPGDPLTAARIDACRQRGENPFSEFQLPQAVIGLKQGIGRLVRDADDRGLFVICDPRLVTKSYGNVFLRSLPPIPVTKDLERAENFMRRINLADRRQTA